MKPPTKEELAARGIDVKTYESLLRSAALPEGNTMDESMTDMKPEAGAEMKPGTDPMAAASGTENEIPPEFIDEVQRDLFMTPKQAKIILEAAMKMPWWKDVKPGSVGKILAEHKDELPLLDKKPMNKDDMFV